MLQCKVVLFLVAIDDGGEAVRDQDGRSAAGGRVERAHDAALGDGVQGGRGLVEHFRVGIAVKKRAAKKGPEESAVAESNSPKIGASFRMARAIATRCFSPPESLRPLSPTWYTKV